MDTAQAFLMGMASRGNTMKVFDWNKAAKLINESGAKSAIAGLRSDMEWTSGEILEDGKPVPKEDTYTYLASSWATPVLVLDDDMDRENLLASVGLGYFEQGEQINA